MRVKLIQVTKKPIDVMWTAARTCYSAKSPIEMWEEINKDNIKFNVLEVEKHWNLVKKVLDSGHQSVAEHVYFTFLIEGVSRALLAQLTRHRTGIVFSVMSQRYVEIKEDISNILRWEEAKPILDKYFIDVNTSNWQEYLDCLKHYLHHIQMGMKAEDARNILPNATKTNITMSINLRELMHVSNLRLCCFDDKTEVLTTDGWKFFKDLKGDETFYSLNPLTLEGEYSRCKNLFSSSYTGEMVCVDSQSISLCTTPNHKMFCSYSYDKKRFLLDDCSNHVKHKRILMKKNCKSIKGLSPETFVLQGYVREDKNQYTIWNEIIPERIVPIKEFFQILGFYLSDGYATKVGYHYNVGFSKGSKEKLERYQKLLEKISPHKSRIYKDGNAWKLEVHDRHLYNYFEKLGKVLQKHIPNELFLYDSSLLKFVFKGLIDGDANKEETSYWTSSKQLKDDFQRLCLHVGYSATACPIDRRGQERTLHKGKKKHTFVESSVSYCVSINKSKNEPIIKTTNRDAFSVKNYNGYVYCVELEKNNILYVRRNNKCVWSGNSRAQLEIRQLFQAIKKEVEAQNERLASLLVPSCEVHGFCTEHQCCGRKPKLKDIKKEVNNV
jgi:flavin-dependent thymidylate synthase